MNNLHLQSDAISQAKSDIIDKFFKNALWIDDSIIDDITQVELDSNIVQSHFDPFVKYVSHLAERGITCALKGYNPREECDDGLDITEIEKCANLAKKSDILFLDWHLTDGTPSASIEIINKIVNEQGFKIIIVITAHPNYQDDIKRIAGFNQEHGWLTNGNGIYVTNLNKENLQSQSPYNFWEEIKSKLLHITPNILSWIALGLSAEIKEFTPRWISSLPKGIEFATCMHQLIIDNPTVLSGDLIIKNLFEDLKHLIPTESIPIASNETFSLENLQNFSSLLSELKSTVENLSNPATIDKSLKNKFKSSKEAITNINDLCNFDKSTAKQLVKALNVLSNMIRPIPPGIEILCDSCKTLTTFSENLSLIQHDTNNIRRGNVYTHPESNDDLYICISQECDCIRAHSLIFLHAKKSEVYDLNNIYVYFKKELYSIELTGASIIPKNVKTTKTGRAIDEVWDLAGCLRRATIDKITHDFWQNSTRIGVDIPEYERLKRK